MTCLRQSIAVALFSLMGPLTACGVDVPLEDSVAQTGGADATVDTAGLAAAFRDMRETENTFALTMARVAPFAATAPSDELDPRLVQALADCQCQQDKFSAKYLARLVTRGGAMPQLLMPMVREGVAADPQVRRLLAMPPGYRSVLDGIINVDNMVKRQVKTTVAGKIASALQGGSTIADRYDFRFDGFANATLGTMTSPRTFSISDQATRWNYILGVDAMWAGKRPVDSIDHGLQLLNTALTLAEWSYMFGLDVAASDGRVYGGVTLQPEANSPANLYGLQMTAFDPRKDTAGMRFVSGAYTVDFPAADSLQMATEVREVWQRDATTVSLNEQALMWRAAARAMERMRPSARSSTKRLYAPGTGIFPGDAHTAALLFLPGMDLLLDGPFFSTAAQSVRDEADFTRRDDGTFDPAGYPDVRAPAFNENRVLGLARLASALSSWVAQVKSIDDLDVDEATGQRLRAAHGRLKDPVRLALVVMMRELPADLGGMGTSADKGRQRSNTSMEPGPAAEILFHVASTVSNGMESEVLKARVFALMDYFAVNYLKPACLDAARRASLDASEIVWIHNALAAVELLEGSAERYPWLLDVRSAFAKVIADWNNRL